MITRRGFMLAGGSAVSALSLIGAGPVAAAFAQDLTTIASPARPLALAEQGRRHIVLTGDRLADVRTLETVLTQAATADLRLSLDTADQVLFDIAQTRTSTRYAPVAAATGLLEFRRTLAGA